MSDIAGQAVGLALLYTFAGGSPTNRSDVQIFDYMMIFYEPSKLAEIVHTCQFIFVHLLSEGFNKLVG